MVVLHMPYCYFYAMTFLLILESILICIFFLLSSILFFTFSFFSLPITNPLSQTILVNVVECPPESKMATILCPRLQGLRNGLVNNGCIQGQSYSQALVGNGPCQLNIYIIINKKNLVYIQVLIQQFQKIKFHLAPLTILLTLLTKILRLQILPQLPTWHIGSGREKVVGPYKSDKQSITVYCVRQLQTCGKCCGFLCDTRITLIF